MKIPVLHIPQILVSAPLLHILNNTWSIRHCSFGNMVGVKLYLFVILLLGILLVTIKSSNLYMFIGHLYFLFYEVPEQVICPFYYWISQVKKKKNIWYMFIMYILYSDSYMSQICIKYTYAHTGAKCWSYTFMDSSAKHYSYLDWCDEYKFSLTSIIHLHYNGN